MMARHATLIATVAGLIPLLMSCHSAPTRIYTLYPVAPVSTMGLYVGPPIRIDAVHIPPALDRIEVVINVAPGELRISDLDHWSAPLAEVAKQVLSADMVSRLPPGRVIFPHLSKPEGALGVSVDILEFRADAESAYFEASWIITPTSTDAVSRRGTGKFGMKGSDASASAIVQTLSALLAQLADQIAADLLQGANEP